MSAAANTDVTLGSVSGTAVVFFPVPTPWPSSAGCDDYIYRQIDEGTLIAWDPVYTISFNTAAKSCFPPQQASWWSQASDANPSTALGPTFVCPEAFHAVHNTVLESNTASQTQYTYCCPANFGLNTIPPQNQRTIAQCTSTAGPGVTMSFVSVNFVTTTVTTHDADGSSTVRTGSDLLGVLTSTVVEKSAATVYAPPINGFNIVAQKDVASAAEKSATSNTATTPSTPAGTSDVSTQSSASTQSGSLAPGAIAGIVVGTVLGLGLLALGAFFIWRKYPRRPAADQPSPEAVWRAAPGDKYGAQYGPVVSEMPVENQAAIEMPHNIHAHELPAQRWPAN